MRGICISQECKYNDKRNKKKQIKIKKYRKEKSNTLSSQWYFAEEETSLTKTILGNDVYDQANKGIGRMPWHQAPKKDVTSCDKLRGVANELWAVDVRMRKLTNSNMLVSIHEYIVYRKGTQWTETSK